MKSCEAAGMCWNGFSAALGVRPFLPPSFPPRLLAEPVLGPGAGTSPEAEDIAWDGTGGSFLSSSVLSGGEKITQLNKKTFQMECSQMDTF